MGIYRRKTVKSCQERDKREIGRINEGIFRMVLGEERNGRCTLSP